MGFVNRMDQNVAKYWYPNEKIQGACVLHRIHKGKGDEPLPLLAFRRFPSDICYDDTKHCQVQSERRRIQNPFKHLRGNVFV